MESLNRWLGGRSIEIGDARYQVWRYQVWRYVGAGWAAAMAFSLRWLRRELRGRCGALVPIILFFSAPGVLALGASLFSAAARAYLVLAVILFSCPVALTVAASLAWSDISGRADGVLIPRPVGPTILGWTATETEWLESILAASLPPAPAEDQPGFGEVDLGDFWEEYFRKVPLHFRLGLRMATWVVTFWPLVTFRAAGTFHGLDEEGRDEVLRSIEHSRFFVVRQVAFVLKTTIGFGYFRMPEMQRRFPTAYGQSDGGGVEESGERKAESGGERRAEGGERRGESRE